MILRPALALLASLAGAGILASAAPALAESHAAAEAPVDPLADPAADAEAARADLREQAAAMETRLAEIVTELEAEITRQEDSAGFGASEDLLAQIDTLRARRDAFAEQLAQVRALLVKLEGAD